VLDHNSTIPLYVQIANWLETEILKGNFKVDEKVYSQYRLADMFQINPATAARGLTLLSELDILYDRRGLGKFVTSEAIDIIKLKRKEDVLVSLIKKIVKESNNLAINETELLKMITSEYRKSKGGK